MGTVALVSLDRWIVLRRFPAIRHPVIAYYAYATGARLLRKLNHRVFILERRAFVFPTRKEDQITKHKNSLKHNPRPHIRRIGVQTQICRAGGGGGRGRGRGGARGGGRGN